MATTDARPTNPRIVTEADVYEAVRQFVFKYALPGVPLASIYQGWQNRAALPAGNEYTVISILWTTQHGTAVEDFEAGDPDKEAPGTLTVKALREIVVQVDFCSETDTARERADRVSIVARSSFGVMHFNDYGLSSLYADNVRDLSFVGAENQFVRRCAATLHLSTNNGVTADFDYFDTVQTERIENVDVHHDPREK